MIIENLRKKIKWTEKLEWKALERKEMKGIKIKKRKDGKRI